MVERWLVPAGATILSIVLLLAGIVSPFFLFITFAPAPCTSLSVFYELARLAVPFSLLASAVLLYRLRYNPRARTFAVGLAISAVALGTYAFAARLDAGRQSACAKRSLTQARASCGVDAAHYRAGKDQYGNATLTLVAPGTTDGSWNCLSNWATHNGSVSLLIDESVYEEYRRTHR
jgi:hypothetical protein